MPLAELRSTLSSEGVASYMVQRSTVQVDLAECLEHLSPPAQRFVALVAGADERVTDLDALYAVDWRKNPRIHVEYSQLSPDQRVEVLIYFTLPQHEFLHHIDMLQTPFGVAFHLAAAREYVNFQQFAELLFEGGPQSIPPGRIIDLPAWLKGQIAEIGGFAKERFDNLANDLKLMETWGDFDRVKSASTVVDSDNVFEALGKRFVGVRINDAWSSFTVEGMGNWYMRPATILEGRAVVLSILWASDQLNGLESEGRDLAHFVRSVYGPDSDPDYRFLPDLAAWWTSHHQIEDLLIRQVRPAARFVLSTLYAFAWIALHAPPVDRLTDRHKRYYPPERFMAGLTYALLKYTEKETVTLDDIMDFDKSQTARNFKLPDAEESLAIGIKAVGDLRNAAGAALNPEIRAHFRHSATLLESSLSNRKGKGYMWPAGFGPSPMLALRARSPELLEPYRPGRSVDQWLDFRRRAFFRPTSASKLWPVIAELFSGRPLNFVCLRCDRMLRLFVSKFVPHYRVTCPCGCTYNFPPQMFKTDFSAADPTEQSLRYDYRPLDFPCSCGNELKAIIFGQSDSFGLACGKCGLEYNIAPELLQRLRQDERIALSEIYAAAKPPDDSMPARDGTAPPTGKSRARRAKARR